MNELNQDNNLICPDCKESLAWYYADYEPGNEERVYEVSCTPGCNFTLCTKNLQTIITLIERLNPTKIDVKPELIIYLRHSLDEQPYGVIVMTGPNNIGWSVCSNKDQFCKNIGRTIARNRASKGIYHLPKNYYGIDINQNKRMDLARDIIKEYRIESEFIWKTFIHGQNKKTRPYSKSSSSSNN